MTTELDKLPITSDDSAWTDDQKALMMAVGAYRKEEGKFVLAPRDVVVAFLSHVNRSGLDPVARQIYLIFRAGKWTIQSAIDGFRVVAGRHADYDGTESQWCGTDGVWLDVWPDIPIDPDKPNDGFKPPMAARTLVYSKGSDRPTIGVAKWSEFAVIGRGGENWLKMPSHMLAKVSEALGLRKRYPQDFSGIYTEDELGSDPTAGHVATRDWLLEAKATTTVEEIGKLYEELRSTEGAWTQTLDAEFRSHKAILVAKEREAERTEDADVVDDAAPKAGEPV